MSVVCILIWGQMSYMLLTGGGGGANVHPCQSFGDQMSSHAIFHWRANIRVCVLGLGRGRLRDCSHKKQLLLGRFSQTDFFLLGRFIRGFCPCTEWKRKERKARSTGSSSELSLRKKKKKKKKNALRNAKNSFFEKNICHWVINLKLIVPTFHLTL